MDNWFLTKALSWCYLGFCQVYIALGSDGVVGFFSLSPTSVQTGGDRAEANGTERTPWSTRESCSAGLPLGGIFRRAVSAPDQLLLDEAIRRAFSIWQAYWG